MVTEKNGALGLCKRADLAVDIEKKLRTVR
jgi:hypothetical protein